jgi:hypothetical protein
MPSPSNTFVGDQAKSAGWAIRNSGIMCTQTAASMGNDQDLISIEVQLLGGNGKDARTTSFVYA